MFMRASLPASKGLLRSSAKLSVRSFATEAKKDGKLRIEFPKGTFEVYKSEMPAMYADTSKEELLSLYTTMVRIRRMELAADQLYKQKLIRGFCHLYNGQEAISAGIEAAITEKDNIITAYRDHGLMVGRGADPKGVIAELTMRATGCSKGKGGSMHMFDIPRRFWGGHGIVGAQTPLGAGIALAQQYLNTGAVTFTFYGDGAANQGQLYEAFNMAQLWKLPVIFVCENNQYAMGTSTARAAADMNYYTRGHFIPGIKVDGMNALAVKAATAMVTDYVRKGNGPYVMEMNTYRYVGHSMSDPGVTYRTREEISAVRAERDPIDKVKAWIFNHKLATEDEVAAIEAAAKKEMDEAVEFSINSPFPEAGELYTDVYTHPEPARAVELANSYTPSK